MSKIERCNFSEFEYVDVWCASDFHVGHLDFDKKECQRYIDWVKEKDNRFLIGGGDYIENTISAKARYGDAFITQIMTIDAQRDLFIKMFEPIKDRILGLIMGNHEIRTIETAQTESIMDYISEKLECPIWGGTSEQVDVRFWFSHYKSHLLHIRHGKYAGEYLENRLKKILRSDTTATDLLLIGHAHQLVKTFIYRKDVARERLNIKRVYGVGMGSMMKFAGYAKRLECLEGEVGNPIIRFYPNEYWIALGLDEYYRWKE